MADTDLVFVSPASGVTTELVFGDAAGGSVDTVITVSAGLLPEVAVRVGIAIPVAVAVVLPEMTVSVRARYVSGASRPLVGEAATSWQAGAAQGARAGQAHSDAVSRHIRSGIRYQRADQRATRTAVVAEAAVPTRTTIIGRHQDGVKVQVSRQGKHQDGVRNHTAIGGGFQQGTPLSLSRAVRHQDGIRTRRNRTAGRWQDAVRQSTHHSGSVGTATHLDTTLGGRHQQSRKAPPGIWDRAPVTPPVDVCYTPSGALVFSALWHGSPNLVFVCDERGTTPPPVATVVVPIKRVYVVLNESSLRRVDGNIPLPTLGMSMSLDVDSWTWSFDAALPGRALADLEPGSPGEAVLVEAMINGVAYRMQVERRSRDRSFGSSAIRIGGRGVSAALDSPYSPTLNHTNSGARTAQQLMNDILTLNGVSIGWTVDWQAVDWSIPAGLFAHQGPYISALNAIAAAAGSYIQPHRTAQTLHVLPRYPDLPWEWDSVTPDYEIPSAIATVEGIEWIEKALYNRVFVSGIRDGVLGQVTRAGTDGGLVAPMVTDALITTEAAARQRGTPILADTGPQAYVSLRLPVLPEIGVIVPGKYVRYTDGSDVHMGISRSVRVDDGSPEIWQTISLETHV